MLGVGAGCFFPNVIFVEIQIELGPHETLFKPEKEKERERLSRKLDKSTMKFTNMQRNRDTRVYSHARNGHHSLVTTRACTTCILLLRRLRTYHLPFMALTQSAALTTEPKTTCTAPSLALATTRVTGPNRLHSH